MSNLLDDALEVFEAYGIDPNEEFEQQLPEIGEIESSETLYATSLRAVNEGELDSDDDSRLGEWWEKLGQIENGQAVISELTEDGEGPEPHCAWYCPIHFFGRGWGIFIRERCLLSVAIRIARYVDWSSVGYMGLSLAELGRRLMRSAFYALFLHEQFHHKVESLGFRLLVSTGSDRYRPYKSSVYRPTYMTPDCLEESLANAESYLRLSEERYVKRLGQPFKSALQSFLVASFAVQPPGYCEALNYITDAAYKLGQQRLHSAMLDGLYPPTTPSSRWAVAPYMMRARMNIDADIYVILPAGAKPLFRPTTIDPGVTISTERARKSLIEKYGYSEVSGGKGSHVKLIKIGHKPIVLRGNQGALSPGLLRDVLSRIGDFPISRARDIL